MCMIDGEPVWPATKSTRRARKAHRCGECGREIEPGETYEYLWGICDGEQFIAKTCAHCVEAREWLDVVCEGWLYSMVAQDLREHVDGDESYMRSRPLTRLVRWQGAKWRRRDGQLRTVEEVGEVVVQAIERAQEKLAADLTAA